MTAPFGSLEQGGGGSDASPRVKLTVRLYVRAHELLIAEFEHLGRRRRAPRAAQLMLVGLLCERANLRPGAGPNEVAPPVAPEGAGAAGFGLAAEADAFVSAILRPPGSPVLDEDPSRLAPVTDDDPSPRLR